MKKTILMPIIIVLSLFIVIADDFEIGRDLVVKKIPCNQLNQDQLEAIGDYFMEQMHPGKLHEIMDERMGGEGSESLRQIHINLAQNFYCGNRDSMPASRMNMMMNRGGYNMMGYNNLGYNFGFFGWFLMIIFWVAIIAFIVWVIQQLIRNKESSHDILEKRYSRGEISKKQYQEMKKDLRR